MHNSLLCFDSPTVLIEASPVSPTVLSFGIIQDILIADEGCSYSIQQGLGLSRSAVHFFKHNDMEDLERVVKRVEAKEKADKCVAVQG